MAVTDSAKLDYLWKKLGYGLTKTDTPANKEAFNESIPSPLLARGDRVWQQSALIANVQPTTGNTAVVAIYNDSGNGAATVECTEDITASDNRTWKTNLTDWIPTEFGSTYLVKVYVANVGCSTPQTTGIQLFQAGSGNNDEWFFDYQSGVLNFNGANIPTVIQTGITGKSVYIAGARYIGTFGVGSANTLGNLTVSDTTISTVNSGDDIVLQPTASGVVTIDTDTGLVIPTGNTSQRPGSAVTGTIRYNTDADRIEVYDGSEWDQVVSDVVAQAIMPDGVANTYVLDRASTDAATLVAINGIVQLPTVAYTVAGNSITFAEVPQSTDIIDIRFL